MADVPTIHPYWLAVPLALLPGLLGLWWGRAIPADPAVLPEWNFTQTQRMTWAATTCTMAIVAIARWGALWLLPLEFLAVSIARHRARRALFGESWPLVSYLAWRVRAFVAAFGQWTFIALSPAIVVSVSDAARWWTALACAAIALLWHHFSAAALVRLLGASMLVRPDLEAGFTQVFDRCSVARPALWRAGAPGGVLANALALPSLRGHGVLFFDTLLDQLSPDQIAAILAHEVAHLEDFNGRQLRRMYIGGSIAIVAVLVVAAVLATTQPDLTWLVTLLWPAGVIGGLFARAARMQGHETKSDLRAVELCGSGDALISALTRIYTINHIPRRFSAHTEERATHPSLARRIRDIRERSGQAPPAQLDGRRVFASSDKGRFAILEQTRLSFVWSDAEPAGPEDDIAGRASRIETLAYRELAELRLTTSTSGVSLTAIDHHSRRWTMPLRREDPARVQSALDVVDQLLGRPEPRSGSTLVNRLIALCVLGLATGLRSGLSILVPAVLIFARPSRQLLVAMSASLVGAALLSLNSILADEVLAIVLLLLAAFTLWRARSEPAETVARTGISAWMEPAGLALPSLAGVVMAVSGGGHPYDIHVLLRDQPWLASSLLGAVGFLGASPQRAIRRITPAAAVIALAALWAASPWFVANVGGDRLVADMPGLQERHVTVHPVGRAHVSGELDYVSVALAPDGRHFMLFDTSGEYDGEEPPPRRFVVGDFNGWSRELRAIDARLVDDHRLMVLDHRRGDSELRLEDIRGGDPSWALIVPDAAGDTIAGTSGERWRLLRRDRKTLTRVDGQFERSSFDRLSWKTEAGELGSPFERYADDSPIALALVFQWSAGLFEWPWISHSRTSLMTAGGGQPQTVATTHLMIHCVDPAIEVKGFVCIAHDGRRSFVWRLDAASGSLTPVGQTRGYLQARTHDRRDRLSATINGLPAQVALDAHSIAMLRFDDDACGVVLDHAVAGPLLVAACRQEDETLVTLYRMDD